MKRVRPAESNPWKFSKSVQTGFHVPWTALLLAILVYCHWQLVSSIPLLAVQFDAVKVYLPGAQHLLEDGFGFFFTREAYRTAPLNFVWPALFGADTDAILVANMVLGVSILLLVFFTAKRLGGLVAAVAAATLYAFSPLLVPLIPTILSEPLFLAGTALWLLGIAHHDSPGKAWLIAAVLGGIVSLLARPVWLPFIALSLPFLLGAALAQPKEPAWKKLALAHALILLPVGLYCLHNLVQFGFFGISTGSGAALYLGNHPLTFGIEPKHLLFDYDVQSMTIPWEGDYLSVAGDRALRTIGWSMIVDRTFAEQLDWMLYKVGAVMFFTKSDFAVDLYSIRALRVFEWIFALYGLTFVRSRALRYWFAGALLLQMVQLSMILYNLRYSSGSLEIWLILLAGCGLGKLSAGVRARLSSVPYGLRMALDFDKYSGGLLPRAALVVVVLLGCGVAHWHRRLTDPLQPNIDHAPTRALLQLDDPQLNQLQSRNVAALPNGAYWIAGDEGLFAVDLPAPPHNELGYNQMWMLELTIVPPDGKSCRGGHISYESAEPRNDVPFEALPIEFKGDGVRRRYAISATYPFSPLYPASEGILRLRPFCPRHTQLAIHRIALLESTAPTFYLKRVTLP